jgi:hypothetical protein
VIFAVVFYFLLSLTLYRLPSCQGPILFEHEVVFDFVDIRFSNREIFETVILNNSVITLTGEGNRFFVSPDDRNKLWELSLRDVVKARYTLKVEVLAQPLMFGGYGVASVTGISKIDKLPLITK